MSIWDGDPSPCGRFIIAKEKSTDEDLLGHIRILAYDYVDNFDEAEYILSAIHQIATMKRKVWLMFEGVTE